MPTWEKQQFQEKTDSDFTNVSEDIDEEDLSDIKSEYDQAKETLAKNQYDLDANLTKAGALLLIGETDKAMDIYKKMTELYPLDARAFDTLGTIYDDQKNYAEAEKNLLTAIKLQPQSADAYITLAAVYRHTREESENREKVTKFYTDAISALSTTEDNIVMLESYAKSLERIGDYAKAIEEWNAVLAITPDDQFVKDKIADLQAKMAPAAPAEVPALVPAQ